MVWESQPQTTIFKRNRDQISGLLLKLKPAFTCHVKYRILAANGAGSGTIQVWKHCMRRPIKYLPNSRTHNMEIHFPCQIIPWRSFNGRLARNQLNQWDQGSWRKCFITTSVFVAASLKKIHPIRSSCWWLWDAHHYTGCQWAHHMMRSDPNFNLQQQNQVKYHIL